MSSSAQRTASDEEMATTSNTPQTNQTLSTIDPGTSSVQPSGNSQRYATELQIMRDMGLTEENSNLQALILCNGNVEAAVTLVLGLGNFA